MNGLALPLVHIIVFHMRSHMDAFSFLSSNILELSKPISPILFASADIGMAEAGLAETIVDAISAVHPHLHGLLYSNILLTGGMAQCPGFKERLEKELRPLVPDDYEINVVLLDDPQLAAWRGGALLGASPAFAHMAVRKAEWVQHGAAACAKWDT